MNGVTQQIHPFTKRNGCLFILISGGGFVLLLLTDATTDSVPWPVRLCLSAFCLIALVLGIGKLIEPATSLEITPHSIRYQQIRGDWTVLWEDLQRFDIVTLSFGMDTRQLPFLGIRLRRYEHFLEQISPRLAVHLLHQQRALMLQAVRNQMPAHRQYTDYLEVPEYFLCDNGQRFTGVLASFAMRMTMMRELLGYDLYIPQNALDRPLPEFLSYLHELERTRQPYLDAP